MHFLYLQKLLSFNGRQYFIPTVLVTILFSILLLSVLFLSVLFLSVLVLSVLVLVVPLSASLQSGTYLSLIHQCWISV